MRSLDNITTGDKYTDANTIESPAGFRLAYLVGNNAVRAQFRPYSPTGTLLPWTPADPGKLITPEANTVEHVSGFRVRSAVAGSPAQVIADLYEPDDPLAGSPIPYTATLSPSGGQTPGKSSVQIQVDGALVGTEPTLDFLTGLGIAYVGTDDPTNQRVTLAIAGGAKVLADSVLVAPAGSVTLSGLSSAYKDLLVLLTARCDQNVAASYQNLNMAINGDATANYFAEYFTAQGTSTAAAEVLAGTAAFVAEIPNLNAIAGFGAAAIHLPDYSSGRGKTWLSESYVRWGATTGLHRRTMLSGQHATIAAAISSLAFSSVVGNLIAGTRITVVAFG